FRLKTINPLCAPIPRVKCPVSRLHDVNAGLRSLPRADVHSEFSRTAPHFARGLHAFMGRANQNLLAFHALFPFPGTLGVSSSVVPMIWLYPRPTPPEGPVIGKPLGETRSSRSRGVCPK